MTSLSADTSKEPIVDSQPHVKVTLDMIYHTLTRVESDLAEVKSTSTAAQVADHETRLRSVEKMQWRWAGAAAASGAAISQLFGKIFGTE